MLFLCLVLLLAVNLLIFLRIARHCIFRGSNYFQWLDHFVFNNIPMILLMCLLLLLAIDLLLFLRNTSHRVKVFVLYLVHKILLLCILLLLLGINLSSCSILKCLFVCLFLRYQRSYSVIAVGGSMACWCHQRFIGGNSDLNLLPGTK